MTPHSDPPPSLPDDEIVPRLTHAPTAAHPESVIPTVDASWMRLAQHVATPASRIRQAPSGAGWPVGARYATMAAAIVLLVIGAFVGGSRFAGRSAKTAGQMLTYATANGQRAKITLPDGSTASLNVASRLSVPADYAAGNRTLQLTGEALFTVVKQSGAPFTVIAGPGTARVLGTSFIVRHYATDSATDVLVRDGKVGVGDAVLGARQRVSVTARSVSPVQTMSVIEPGFDAGVLRLADLPLARAIVELDRWYDADIRLGDPSLGAQRLTGKFVTGSLADLTEFLEFTMDVRVVRRGRMLTLYPRA